LTVPPEPLIAAAYISKLALIVKAVLIASPIRAGSSGLSLVRVGLRNPVTPTVGLLMANSRLSVRRSEVTLFRNEQ